MAKNAEHTVTPSQRQLREWPLLVLALALVFAICIPLCAALKTGRGRGLAKRSCWDWRHNPIRRTIRGGFVLTQYCARERFTEGPPQFVR